VVFVRLTPDRFRLGFHTPDSAKNRNGSVKYPHGAFNLDGEVHVAGCINNIYLMIPPETGCGRRRYSNTPLAFLLHPVHCGGAFMNLAHLVLAAGIKQDTLRSRRLPGIDMSGNPDVSYVF
jgi:hypothetical protein